jgi:putative oxidoreductase
MRRMYGQFLDDPAALGLLILRLVAGFGLIMHGYPKLVHATTWMGSTSGVPGWLQAMSPLAEFGGGLALVFGLLTPLAVLGIMANMATALFLVHFANRDPFVAPSGWTGSSYETAAMYLAIAFMFLLTGPGRHSVDHILFGRRQEEARQAREREYANWR